MKTSRAILFGSIGLIALVVMAFANDPPSSQPQAKAVKSKESKTAITQTNAASDFPVLGYIEKRGRTITIKAGPKGPVYSVKTSDGKTLFENLSAEQLRAQAPEVSAFLKTAVAAAGGANDARLNMKAGLGMR